MKKIEINRNCKRAGFYVKRDFTKFPNSIIRSQIITQSEKIVLLHYLLCRDNTQLTQAYYSNVLGKTEKQVNRILSGLAEKGIFQFRMGFCNLNLKPLSEKTDINVPFNPNETDNNVPEKTDKNVPENGHKCPSKHSESLDSIGLQTPCKTKTRKRTKKFEGAAAQMPPAPQTVASTVSAAASPQYIQVKNEKGEVPEITPNEKPVEGTTIGGQPVGVAAIISTEQTEVIPTDKPTEGTTKGGQPIGVAAIISTELTLVIPTEKPTEGTTEGTTKGGQPVGVAAIIPAKNHYVNPCLIPLKSSKPAEVNQLPASDLPCEGKPAIINELPASEGKPVQVNQLPANEPNEWSEALKAEYSQIDEPSNFMFFDEENAERVWRLFKVAREKPVFQLLDIETFETLVLFALLHNLQSSGITEISSLNKYTQRINVKHMYDSGFMSWDDLKFAYKQLNTYDQKAITEIKETIHMYSISRPTISPVQASKPQPETAQKNKLSGIVNQLRTKYNIVTEPV
jgi:hypothetical protein